MDHKRIIKHLPLMLAGIAMGLGVFINVNTSKHIEPVEAAIDYSACETAYNANNKSNLKTALYNVVKDGSAGDYDDLWTSYWTVYKRSDGYLKDYYSNTSTFTSDDRDRGSGGTTEGDKYNREHTIPKSWWGGSTSNQGADIFIVVPADKLVNNKRSDNCLGVVGSATYSSNNNYSKLGSSSASWNFFGSPVFEPNDEVKGDLARIVFYSVIKYNVASWTTGNGSYVYSGSTSASSNFGLTANAVKLFSYWNNLDKPDDWERTVNTRGNSVQGNPNPFIDHPEYANTLWGDVSGYTTYSTSSASLSISPSSGSISVGGTLNLTATASGGSGNVTWSITSGNSYVSLSATSGTTITVTGDAAGSATVTASYSGVSASSSITVTSSGGGSSTTSEGSVSASSGSLSGWTASGTGSAYADGSVKFDSSGDCIYKTNIFSGDVSLNMTSLSVTVNATINGTPTDANSYKIEALNSSGLSLGEDSNTGSSVFVSGSYKNCTFTISEGLTNCTGIKFTYVTKGGGNLGVKSISWVATYTASSSPSPSLSSITISGYTTAFTEGDTFNFGGTVTANYSDSTSTNVTNAATFSGYDMTSVGNQTVTVTYEGKTKTYGITVSAGTLSSIAVSGQTISYKKNATFSFDGTCTATFTNNYQKVVTPTSISSPDMTTTGSKIVTVSYTYNGVTKSTSYTISVNSYRTVMELGYSTIGTIEYTTDSEVISVSSLSTSKSGGYSEIDKDNHAWRLGAGSKTGTLTVSSTSANIYKIVVNAKYYGSDSGTTFTISGTSNTLSSTYTDYTKEYFTAVSSIAISSVTNGKRVLISTITVFTKTNQDIGQSEDCVGLETFITSYMHMDYTENLGYCKDSTHHYYSTAKSAFNALNTHQRSLFTSNSAYFTEWDRLRTWAGFNGDSLNSSNQLTQGTNHQIGTLSYENNSAIIMIIIISTLGISSAVLCLYMRKRKQDR